MKETPAAAPEFAAVPWGGRTVHIEHRWIAPGRLDRPLMVFLHEGLGSLSMWKDFPAAVCDAAGLRGLVYSRPGYGASTPREPAERWGSDFMHRQAHELLPALLASLHVDAPVWLFGHSDGGSIALLYAARHPATVAGVVAEAPHIFVEDCGLDSIRAVRGVYATTDLKQRLARYHADPDSAFFGWNDAWLEPAFRDWNIEAELDTIRAPVLAIQGLDDEYGSLAQIRGIARRVPGTRLLELAGCGHSPHRDRPQQVIDATVQFVRGA